MMIDHARPTPRITTVLAMCTGPNTAAHATPRFILLSCQSSDRARDSAQSSYYWLRFNTTNEIVFSGPQCTEDST